MTPLRKKVYEKLIAKFGEENQINQAVEELAELIVAINHYRKNPNPKTKRELVMEMVDVEIMMEQLKMIYKVDTGYFSGHRSAKIHRAERLLEDKKITN